LQNVTNILNPVVNTCTTTCNIRHFKFYPNRFLCISNDSHNKLQINIYGRQGRSSVWRKNKILIRVREYVSGSKAFERKILYRELNSHILNLCFTFTAGNQISHKHNQHSTLWKIQQHTWSYCNFYWFIFLQEIKQIFKRKLSISHCWYHYLF
jgi:hypothetical protein